MTNNLKSLSVTKRIVSFLICAVMVLGLGTSSFAFSISDDLRDTKYEEAGTVLGALGIMIGDPDGSFRPEDGLKRSEFAKMAIHALGLEEAAESVSGIVNFNDLSTDYWANGYINLAHDQGIVIGDPDGNYRPEDKITYQEAVAVLVRMAGYEPAADAKGGYPQGYLNVANQYGFTKNVMGVGTNVIKRGEAAILTNNTITIGIMEQTGFGTSTNYEITDKTILKEYLDTEKKDGKITGNYFTKLNSASGLDEGMIEIDNTIYKTTDSNAQNLLGHNVSYYLTEKSNREKVVILAISDESKTVEMTIDGDNIHSVETGKINYFNNKKVDNTTKSVRIAETPTLIYNGVWVEYDASLIKGNGELKGNIVLLDNTNDDVYDVIMLNEFSNLVVDSTSSLSYTISDKYGNPSIQLDPENTSLKFRLQDVHGNDVEFSDLKEWDVISYLKSKDGKVISAYVVDSKVEGTVKEIKNSEYKIGDKFYKIADNYKATIKLDDKGIFYLDVMGRIAAVDANSTLSDKYAYLIDGGVTGTFNDTVQIKLFNLNGEVQTLETEERISLNGQAKADAKTVLESLKHESKIVKQLITFEVNAEGKITKINTAEDLSGGSLTINKDKFVLNFKAEDAVYNKTSGKLGNIKITDETIVFDIPASAKSHEDYAIKDKTMFDDKGVYNVEIYDVTEDLNAKIVLVKNSTGQTNDESPMAVITQIATVRNNKDEIVEKLYAIVGDKEVEIETAESGILVNGDGEALKVGDVIQYRTNAQGAIDKITVLFQVANKATEFKTTSGDMELIYGKVEKKFADSINVSVNGGEVSNYSLKDVKVIAVDTANDSNSVTISDAGEIQKFDELSPRRVLIRVYDHKVMEIVIVK